MAKTPPKRRKQQQTRETNWAIVGGLIAVGVLIFSGLLYLALRPGESVAVMPLSQYCVENSDDCIFMGEDSAPVTLVEVADFGCIHCQSFHNETATPLKEQYLDNNTIQWIVLPYALSSSTVPAAASGMCADEQDLYFDYADALFRIEPPTTRLSADGFRQAAETAGLDVDEFRACMDDGRYLSVINRNREAARAVGVTGTPTFYLNDEVLNGAQPLSVFSQAIATLLSAQ